MLLYATGIRSFDMKNAPTLIIPQTMASGTRTLWSEMPAALIASSSLFSPSVPRVIIDESRVARGSDNGSRVALPQPKNSRITLKLNPLPTSSSMYSQRNCIIRMNTTTSRIAINGPMNDFNMNWSSFFIPIVLLIQSSCQVQLQGRSRPFRLLSQDLAVRHRHRERT